MTALDEIAESLGLRTGMPVAKAQALVAGLVVMDADTGADGDGLGKLALWAQQRVTPIVMADPPDGLLLDTAGADHLHGGEAAMLSAIVRRFTTSGVTVRAAIADTWGMAHAGARFATRSILIVPQNESEPILRRLPVAGLRLAPDIVAGMRTLGLESIGDLLDQPRAPLTLRFGPEPGRRLDQALGRLAEPIEPVREPDVAEVRRVFGEPIGAAETIARYTGKLVIALCAELESRGVGARQLDLLFHRVDRGGRRISDQSLSSDD